MQRRTMIFTGVLGWAGGLATAFAVSSCDPEECTATDAPRASVVVSFATQDGKAVAADEVRYSVVDKQDDGSFQIPTYTQPGTCLDDDCTRWAVGVEEDGHFRIEAEACGETQHASIEVGLDEAGCHVDTERVEIEVDGVACAKDEDFPLKDPAHCDKMARPSAHIWVVQRYDDYYATVPVDKVYWTTKDGGKQDARCLTDLADGSCYAWVAGYEIPGKMEISTEWCDVEVKRQIDVGMTEDGCHVQTEYMMLEVETRGCLAGVPQPIPDKDPPWRMTAPAHLQAG